MAFSLGSAIIALILVEVVQAAIQSRQDAKVDKLLAGQQAILAFISSRDLEAGGLASKISFRSAEARRSPSEVHGASKATFLLIDCTRSMAVQPLREAVSAYLSLVPSDDLVGVITFAERGASALPLGVYSESELVATIGALEFNGSFTDTVAGIQYASDAIAELGTRSRIVVFTDGRDDSGLPRAERSALQIPSSVLVEVVLIGNIEVPLPLEVLQFDLTWRYSEDRSGLIREW
jgi:hypothetical protein